MLVLYMYSVGHVGYVCRVEYVYIHTQLTNSKDWRRQEVKVKLKYKHFRDQV